MLYFVLRLRRVTHLRPCAGIVRHRLTYRIPIAEDKRRDSCLLLSAVVASADSCFANLLVLKSRGACCNSNMRRSSSSTSHVEMGPQSYASIRLAGSGHNFSANSAHAIPASNRMKNSISQSDSRFVQFNNHHAIPQPPCIPERHHNATKPNVATSRTKPNSIPHLREALHSLESQMASLRTQKHILESRLEQAVRLQSPVQRLPSELLGSIFAIGVLQMEEEDSLLLSTLMLVCKEWTEVVLATPILWSRITVGNHDSLVKAGRKLARSKSVPLDVCIQFSPRMESTARVTELVIHAMDILRPSIWRWRSFKLSVPNRPQAHAALTQCRERAPLLEHLSIQIFHVMQDDYYSSPPLPLFQGHTPNLRSSSFTSFNFGWDTSLTTKLRVLKLGGYWHTYSPSISTLIGILRACPALEEIAFRNMSDTDEDSCANNRVTLDSFGRQSPMMGCGITTSDTNMVSLPRLKKASFYYAGITRVHTIFSQLSFPALEEIEFAYLDNLTPVLGQLKRQSLTSLPLRHLRIESCFVNELKLMKLLRRLNSLHTLELIDVEDVSSNLLQVSFIFNYISPGVRLIYVL